MKVLIIGSGGREHCLAWKLNQSPLVDKIYCAPGNGGTFDLGENVNVSISDTAGLLDFARQKEIDLTVVGPEAPLVSGIVDIFEASGMKIFGPCSQAARLEGSKIFSKEIMSRCGIPTADFVVFDDPREAISYLKDKSFPLVVKADGLAAGKGVIVCRDYNEAVTAVDDIMVKEAFGVSGKSIVIEDYIEGQEASVLVFTDGESIAPLLPAQDYKRAFDNDQGPNTGGMGSYAPAPIIDDLKLKSLVDSIFRPLLNELRSQGVVYRGVLYAGLMMRADTAYVLEFNTRFGDPETQAILPLLRSDLADIMIKTVTGKLCESRLEWGSGFCLSVVLASGGYPGVYRKGKAIHGLERLSGMKDIFVFHAGTRRQDKEQRIVFSDGGRVLNITALGETPLEARSKVYGALDCVYFDDMFFRHDIGSRIVGV